MILLSDFGAVLHVKTTVVPRHLSVVMFFVMVLLAGCGQGTQQERHKSGYDLSTAQATIESLFKAVQENDSSAFMSMMATKEDFVSYYEAENTLPNGTKRSPDQIEKKASAEDILSPTLRAEILKLFLRVREEGLADGIKDWNETVLNRASAEYRNELNQSDARALFDYMGNMGAVKFGYLIKAKRGWVLGYAISGFIASRTPSYDRMIPAHFIK
jgi:hypothetical protein